jgi:hypothetical protein
MYNINLFYFHTVRIPHLCTRYENKPGLSPMGIIYFVIFYLGQQFFADADRAGTIKCLAGSGPSAFFRRDHNGSICMDNP